MYFKLFGIFALILPSVIGGIRYSRSTPWKLTLDRSHSQSFTDGNADGKTPFTIEDVVLGNLRENRLKAYWADNSNIEIVNIKSREIGHVGVNGQYNVVLEGHVLSKYNASWYKFSTDRKLVLIRYDESKIFRHSETSRYVVYSVETKKYYDVAKKERLEAAEWVPQSRSLVYIKDNNIYFVKNIDSKEETFKITTNGIPGRYFNGKGDWVYEEEVLSSGRAFWSSPDGKHLVYLSLDDSNVTSASFPTYGEPRALPNQYVDIVNLRYPKAGTPDPDYGLWHVSLNPLSKPTLLTKKESGREVFYDLKWINNDTVIYLQTNRVQNISQTYSHSVTNPKEKKMLFEHKNPVGWANLKLPVVSKDGQRMLRIEGRPSGKLGNFNHLVLYSMKDKSSYPLAGGAPIDIIDIVHWDETEKLVYYSATHKSSATETHIYGVSEKKDSSSICLSENVKEAEGTPCKHVTAFFSPNSRYVFIQCDGPHPQINILYENSSPLKSPVGVLDGNKPLRKDLEKKLLPEVKNLTVDIAGSFKADVRLFLPPNMDKTGKTKYPLLIYVYGGPSSKAINDRFKLDWGLYMSSNLSVIYGFIDGRNTLRKGENMLFAGYRALGTFEMEDQINVTRYLQKTFSFIDPKRTGIWGWSYGGYATTKILEIDTSNVFKCGIAVAPVADWLYYDSVYTERYMGLPKDNPKGYEKSSVLLDVKNLRNKQYFLIHGNADDNVHYQNAMMIAKVLERNNILFESMSYPDEDHSLRGVKPHLYYTMDRFWKNCFGLKL